MLRGTVKKTWAETDLSPGQGVVVAYPAPCGKPSFSTSLFLSFPLFSPLLNSLLN